MTPRAWEKDEASMLGNPFKEVFLKVVKGVLTPPATSTAVEQLFSRTGLLLEEHRSSMNPDRVYQMLFNRKKFLLNNFEMEF